MSLTTTIHALNDAGIDERWGTLWRKSPQRSPFSTSSFLRATAEVTDGLRVRVHLVEDGSDDVAGCALHWRRRGPYSEVVIPAFTPYSGFLLRDPMRETDVHARRAPLEHLLESIEANYHVIRIHLPPGLDDIRPAVWRGWTPLPLYTYEHELSASEDPTNGWSSSTANYFRQHAEEFDLVEPSAAVCASLCAVSYGRSGREPPMRTDRIRHFLERLTNDGDVVIYGALGKDSNEIEAAVAVPRDDRSAFYWIAGSLPGPAMTVLVGKLFEHLARQGTNRFDFVGANTPSIAEFKRKFGSRLAPYQRIERFTRAELRLLHTLKQILR